MVRHPGRTSALNTQVGLKKSWSAKVAERLEKKQTSERQRLLNGAIAAEKREHRERIEEKRRRREENRRNSGKLQIIRNPAKIKRMSKRQLRNIVTADTTGVAPEHKGDGTEIRAKKTR